jgi:ABC-type oligopeptide transport system ATPase subunit
MSEILLETRDLSKHFPIQSGFLRGKTIGYVKAVDEVSFQICKGETFSLVGESGCGKTTAASLILLLQEPTAGDVSFRNMSMTELSPSERKAYTREVQAVFQDPYGALNPRMRVGSIISEPMEVHGFKRSERQQRVMEALKAVELLDGSEKKFPHEFSGGQRQRIGIARALTMDPALIVLDEPVSNLDVSIRSQILNLLKDIQEERGLSYLLISHDMASVEYMSHHIGVMYLGRLVEVGEIRRRDASPAAPVHRHAGGRSHPAGARTSLATPHYWRSTQPARHAIGLRLSYALPVCDGHLQGG